MFNNLKKHALLPAMRSWDNMFDSMLGKLDLFPGEELHPELEYAIQPEVEVTENAVTVRMALPGFSKEELTVEIENDQLSVCGEHHKDSPCACKGKKILRSERTFAEFSQRVHLPGDIKNDGANAIYCDGILTVSIPRENKTAAFSRKIEVK